MDVISKTEANKIKTRLKRYDSALTKYNGFFEEFIELEERSSRFGYSQSEYDRFDRKLDAISKRQSTQSNICVAIIDEILDITTDMDVIMELTVEVGLHNIDSLCADLVDSIEYGG